jgi:hypothetical protein
MRVLEVLRQLIEDKVVTLSRRIANATPRLGIGGEICLVTRIWYGENSIIHIFGLCLSF